MSKQHQLTESGVNELKSELLKLKDRRGDIAQRLKAAKAEGDLSENADYTAALEDQEYVEGRINEIENILMNAVVIPAPKGSNIVELGNTVSLNCNGKDLSYTVVGSLESNPGDGKISDESPIGKALLGTKVGQLVQITTPNGTMNCKVESIS